MRLQPNISAMPLARWRLSFRERCSAVPVALIAASIQFFAFLALWGLSSSSFEVGTFSAAFAQGGLSAGMAWLAGMAWWWLPIHLLFAPALLGTLTLNLPPSGFLAAFLLLALVYWSSFRTQVPLYLSSKSAWRAVSGLLHDAPGAAVIDLGSGVGGLLSHLARCRPDGRYTGIESAPLPFFLGWLRLRFSGAHCDLRLADFWHHDLARYDVVYAYLSPVPMPALWRKAKAEMRAGSLLVSNTFEVPGVAPTATVRLDDFHASTLYLYRL